MKRLSFVAIVLVLICSAGFSQVAINTDGSAPDGSALLDVQSTSKGVLLPRMTQGQISAIQFPADGLQVYCTTDGIMYIFVAADNQWKEVAYGSGRIFPPVTCGESMTINHMAGNVAPVTKTVTYGTVDNIPGETTKCWITRNLGADQQATAVDDDTEASAGWYWQFNRKQGYKHDGSTLTPLWTITSVTEDFNWLAENDPCAIELTPDWRIPTATEWDNVSTGNWTNWYGPWNSDLKMHAAGALDASDGVLYSRGVYGQYWSSTQTNLNQANYLWFGDGFLSITTNGSKAMAMSVRCLRD